MGLVTSLASLVLRLLPGTSTSKEDIISMEQARLEKYRQNWLRYYGINLAAMQPEAGTSATRINYIKRNLDKIVYFAFGQGYQATHPRYQDQLRLADLCWGKKKIEKLTKIGQQGSVTGDAFIMVAPRAVTNEALKTLDGKSAEDSENTAQAKVTTVVIQSEYCRVFYDPFDSDVMEKVQIRVPFQVQQGDGGLTTHYQFMEITHQFIRTGIVDGELNILGESVDNQNRVLRQQPNPLGRIYVVHIRNYPAGNSVYGFDDVTEAAPLNDAYNERMTDIGEIIAYHSAPITCVFGARAGNLVRGPNKVWGNLPKDGKVENLSMNTDLAAAHSHLQSIKESLHEVTGVPEIAQGSKQAISNTSGVALHTMYLPLIERAETKQVLYTPGLIEQMKLAILWCQKLGITEMIDPVTGDKISVDPIEEDSEWDDFEENIKLTFPSPLPKDELIQVQIQTARVNAGLQSRRRALIALGERDPDTLMKEIAADPPPVDPSKKEKLDDSNGEGRLDDDQTKINSGAGADQGVTRTESGAPLGRPRTTG